MPPRWLCVLILASWLVLTGWLFYDDLLPGLLPGQPPPVTLDPTEEAQVRRFPTYWTVYQNDRQVCLVPAEIAHPRRETFEMIARFPLGEEPQPLPGKTGRRYKPLTVGPLTVLDLSSVYRVNAEGDLQSFEVRLTAVPVVLDELETAIGRVRGKFTVTTYGEVRGGRLRLMREWGESGERGEPYRQLPIARGAPVVLPLHPHKRMRGVGPGQSWRAVIVDPFASAFAGEPAVVRAKVRPTTEALPSWGERKPGEQKPACLVIDYKGERIEVSTWVNPENGNVLAQEATLGGTHWVMVRH